MAISNFRADLQYGQLGEAFVAELGKDISIEVKKDRKAFSTGNIFIERECNGKPSGITSTEATYWVHLLPSGDDITGAYLFKCELLKKAIPKLIDAGVAIEKNWAGDNGRVKGIIISIHDMGYLFEFMNEAR